jgi:hypothetical protein
MLGVFLRSALPDYHLSAEPKETVALGQERRPVTSTPFPCRLSKARIILPSRKTRERTQTWGWGVPMMYRSILATAFEQQVRKLGLTETTCATSTQLREWCERNGNQFYIPEWLLKRWGMHVNADTTVSLESQSLTRGRHTQIH